MSSKVAWSLAGAATFMWLIAVFGEMVRRVEELEFLFVLSAVWFAQGLITLALCYAYYKKHWAMPFTFGINLAGWILSIPLMATTGTRIAPLPSFYYNTALVLCFASILIPILFKPRGQNPQPT